MIPISGTLSRWAAAALVSVCVGCGGINTVASTGSQTSTQVGDVFLDNQVSVDNIQVDAGASPKVYKIKLHNKMWFELVLEVKMDFFDANGAKLDNPWGWRPLTVEPKQDEWITFSAPSDRAENFKLYVQKAD